jgi:hypothetical protein
MNRFYSDYSKASRQPSYSSSENAHPQGSERNLPEDLSMGRLQRMLLDAHNAAALRHKLALIDIEGEHRLALYRSHFNPNQPRVPAGHPDGGQWTSESAGAVGSGRSDLGEQPPSVWSAHFRADADSDTSMPEVQNASTDIEFEDWPTGISTIDDTTTALLEILNRTVATMSWVGMNPQRFGTEVHLAFATQVRLAKLPGIGFFDVETTFSLIPGARYGSKDSVRTDVVLRNDAGDIIAIYDVKTGNADLDRRRVKELLAKTGAAPGTPVFQLHLTHGPSRKAEQVGPNIPTQLSSLRLNVRRL